MRCQDGLEGSCLNEEELSKIHDLRAGDHLCGLIDRMHDAVL